MYRIIKSVQQMWSRTFEDHYYVVVLEGLSPTTQTHRSCPPWLQMLARSGLERVCEMLPVADTSPAAP